MSRFGRLSNAALFCLLPVAACSKSERLVLLDTGAWLAPATHAVISTDFDGQRGSDFRITRADADGKPIGIYIPAQHTGSLYIEARFHDDSACRHGRGETRIDIDGQRDTYNAALSAAAYARPLCSCTPEGFCWENPQPQGNNLSAVWGQSGTDFWMVGDGGSVLHGDGTDDGLRVMAAPTTYRLNAVTGNSTKDVWMVGDGGTVLRWDGSSMKRVPTNSTAAFAVTWPTGKEGELWTAGNNALAYCIRETCDVQRVTGIGSFMALSGTTATGDVYAVDGSSHIVSCGSVRPCGVEAATLNVTLYSVYATSSGDVWAGGYFSGTGMMNGVPVLMKRSGGAWNVDLEFFGLMLTGGQIYHIVGTSSTDFWVAGYDSNAGTGMVMHYDGATWSRAALPGDLGVLNAGYATGAHNALFWSRGGDRYVVCSTAGANPASCSVEKLALGGNTAIWGGDTTNLWSVGYGGLIARGGLGRSWRSLSTKTVATLQSIWGSGNDDVWTVGGNARLHYQGGQGGQGGEWSVEDALAGAGSLRAVWGRGRNEVWAVGTNSTILKYDDSAPHFVSDKEKPMDLPATLQLNGLWGSASGTVFAVGADANPVQPGPVVLMRNATASWRIVGLPADAVQPLQAVWGTREDDVWAVGNGGSISHYDGTRFTQTPSGTTSNLSAVWGSASNDVYAAGPNTLLRWNGMSWRVDGSAPPVGWSDLWGTNARDVWAVGSGKLLHFDGSAWSGALSSPFVPSMLGVWGTGPTHIWTVGLNGAILILDQE